MFPRQSLMNVIYLNLVSKGEFLWSKERKTWCFFRVRCLLQTILRVKYMDQAWAVFSLQGEDLFHHQIFFLRSEHARALFSQTDKQNWCSHLADCSNGKMLILSSDVGLCVSPGKPSPDTPTDQQHTLHCYTKWQWYLPHKMDTNENNEWRILSSVTLY